jgi:hypothetical protein
MNYATFDHLTRRASALARAAGDASPLAADAKNTAKKKLKKKQRQRCQAQVGACDTLLTTACAGDAECLATRPPCCAFLDTCDFPAFLTCLS